MGNRGERSVVVAGPIYADTIFSGLRRLPEPGEEVPAAEVGWAPGGYAISALAMHRLGLQVRLCGEVGSDLYGRAVMGALQTEGLSTAFIEQDPASPTNIAVTLNWNGDRGIVSFDRIATPAMGRYLAALDAAGDGSTLYLSARHPLAPSLMREAKDRGLEVALSLSWQPEFLRSWRLRDLLPAADLLFCNVPEALMVTQEQTVEAAGERLAGTVREVIITRGADGAAVWHDGVQDCAPAHPAVLVDATGAGDVFASTFVATRLWGWSHLDRLRAASWAAGQTIAHIGGGTAAVTRNDLLEAVERVGAGDSHA